MRFPTASAPHLPPVTSVSLMMRRVLYALIPGTAAMLLLFGWGVLFNILLAVATAMAVEAWMLRLRKRPVRLFLQDWSAVLAAVLLALALPPLLPWWLPVLGIAFGLIFGKHLYGGLGFNLFNPAMVGYVMLLVSFPQEMTQWLRPGLFQGPGLLDSLWAVLSGQLPQIQDGALDGITGATPLDQIKTGLGQGRTLWEIQASPLFGLFAGRGWEWINLLFLAGGLWLLHMRVIGWQIPVGVLAGLALPALVFWAVDSDQFASPLFHLLSGAAMLGAFFIATDPVSAATTPRGRLYFGLGIGVLVWVIRTWGGYPEGMAFAVLLMNMCAPLLDRYNVPPAVGGGGSDRMNGPTMTRNNNNNNEREGA